MNNFVYFNPTKIIFGKNTLEKIGVETSHIGKRVLLVSGESSAKKKSTYRDIIESLQNSGCTVSEFSGITPNPTLSLVHKGIKLVQNKKCEVICAVGGGSVMDCAKAIGCGALVQHDVWKFFTTKKTIRKSLPLTCIPTLAGSGSENNSGMVITNDETKEKFGFGNRFLYPKVSILDPETTYTVPKSHTAYGSVDIISHVLESFFTTKVTKTALQDNLAEAIVSATMQNCEKVLAHPCDYNARAQLMWGSSLALSGLTSSGLGKVEFPMHLLEHSLSGLFNTVHGAGLSVIIPAWMTFQAGRDPEKIARLGKSVFKLNGADDTELALMTASYFKKWLTKIGCPTSLDELNIPVDEIEKIAHHTQSLAKVWRIRDYDTETVMAILKESTASK